MEEFKAVEMEYKGYVFRSILEAQWAAFFDQLGIKWDYELQNYKLPSGMKYVPDFKLYNFITRHGGGEQHGDVLWVEVKGVKDMQDFIERKSRDLEKVREFSGIDATPNHADVPNPTIILPSIPKDPDADPFACNWDVFDWLDTGVTTFRYVDGDDYPCFISKDCFDDSHFVLCGEDSSYYSIRNLELTRGGLAAAIIQRELGKRVTQG